MLRIATRQATDEGACSVVRWQHTRLRVYAIQARGLVFESLPLAPRGAMVPPLIGHQLTCVIAGELVSRRGGRERSALPGTALLEPSMAWNERWMGDPFAALLIDWDPALVPVRATEVLPLSPAREAEVAALYDCVWQPEDDAPAGERIVAAAADLLAHLGLDRFDASAGRFASSDESRATARWVSALRSDLPSAGFKRASELTGLGERQLRRHFEHMAQDAGMANSLRSVLVQDRLVAAVRLLGGGRPIAEVAQAAGFGSSRALGVALDHAGMPTATEIRRLARQR